jgi:hypothetical protein
MQTTVAQMEKRYDGAVYYGYHALAAPSSVIARPGAPLLLSQSGVELTRSMTNAQRGWSLLGRLMSVTDGEISRPGASGTLSQMAVGIRYKPLAAQNLSFSGERLFQLGGELPNSWLLRALFSKEGGTDLQPDRQWRRYWLAYGDLAGFIGRYGSLLAYGECRYGVSLSLNGSWAVRPHVGVVARRAFIGSAGDAIQLGAGAGITRYFRGSHDGRVSSLEVRLYGSRALVAGPGTDGFDGASGLTLFSTVRF